MAQRVNVAATQTDMEFEAGTQAIGFHRFTMKKGAEPTITHMEPQDSTVFGVIETLDAGTYVLKYATFGVDGVTMLGPEVTADPAPSIGAQVTLQVASGITWTVVTVP